jgi:hypothetical protein
MSDSGAVGTTARDWNAAVRMRKERHLDEQKLGVLVERSPSHGVRASFIVGGEGIDKVCNKDVCPPWTSI